MYRRELEQISLIDEFYMPFGGKLHRDNRWVILSGMIPWREFEAAYAENFKQIKAERHFQYVSI